MSEEDSWRSEAAYDYVDALSPGDLAWEFLRRNTEYRRSYDEFLQAGDNTEELTREFTSRWGLRFPGRPRSFCSRSTRDLVARRQSGHADTRNGPRFSPAIALRVIRRYC